MLIPDGDSLFRHCIYPIVFKGNRVKAFSPEKLIKLENLSDGSGFIGSVAWERFLPTPTHVHDYGCRLAAFINKKDRVDNKYKEDRRKIYCGAYQLSAKDIRELASTEGLEEVLSSDVVHNIENGEIAHTDLKIVLKENSSVDIEGTKTAILDRLWNSSHGPIAHICTCDSDIVPHPSLDLPLNAGGYLDGRSPNSRRWYILRFHIYRWLWRNSTS